MTEIDLSIIIVNWHSAEYVLACMRSIGEYTASVSYEVIVVDNASFDGCREKLSQQNIIVTFVQSQSNLGFARANNLGAQYAQGNVLLFLNPDTEIFDDAIDRLFAQFQTLPVPGIVGCRLLNSDRTLQTSCVQSLPTVINQVLDADILQRWFPNSRLWGNAILFSHDRNSAEVEAVSGACMMIRREVFDIVGGFSSDFFMYGEDLHLCFKARQEGFHNYHVSGVKIVHHGGGSSHKKHNNFSSVMMRESVMRLLIKSHGKYYATGYRVAMSGTALIRLMILTALAWTWIGRELTSEWRAVFQKWLAIFRWGIGLESWTLQYGQQEQPAVCTLHKASE